MKPARATAERAMAAKAYSKHLVPAGGSLPAAARVDLHERT